MADSFYDIGRTLADKPSLRFDAKGSQIPRTYVEAYVPPAGLLENNPTPDGHRIPPRCVIGSAHPKAPYLIVQDATKSGANDATGNWQITYKLDTQAWAAASGGTFNFPNDLVNDRSSRQDAFGTGSTTIEWSFEVVNAASYTAPAPGVPHPTVPTAVLVAEGISRDGRFAVVRRRYQKLATLIDWEYHPETGDSVRVERQIVLGMAQPGKPAGGSEVTQRALGTGFSMRTTRRINGGGIPREYTIRKLVDYTFPRLLTSVGYLYDGTDARPWPKYRAPFQKQVPARTVVDFHRTMPSPTVLFNIKPTDFDYRGTTFDFSVSAVLNDPIEVYKITDSTRESIRLPASDPTYSAYRARINTEQCVAESVSAWEFNLFRRSRTFITMQ